MAKIHHSCYKRELIKNKYNIKLKNKKKSLKKSKRKKKANVFLIKYFHRMFQCVVNNKLFMIETVLIE